MEHYSKQDFCSTSAQTNNLSSVITNVFNQSGNGNCRPVNMKELPLDNNETENPKTVNSKLQNSRISEMLFSHISVADNVSNKEIFVSENNVSSNTLNTSSIVDQAFFKSGNEGKTVVRKMTNSRKPSLNVRQMSNDDDNFAEELFEANEDEIAEPTNTPSCQLQEAPINIHSPLHRSVSLQTKHTADSETADIVESFSASGSLKSSAELVNRSNTLISLNMETPKHTGNILPQRLKHARRGNKKHVNANTSCEFKCIHCDKAFNNKRYLKKHIVNHGNMQFVCGICCKGFFRKFDLNKHIKRNHSESQNPEIKCLECNKTFGEIKSLRTHQVVAHSSRVDPPSTCDVCKKTYKSRKNMLIHRRFQHRSEIEFICNDCSKVFKFKEALVAHIKAKHLPPTFECKKCEAIFQTRTQLGSHLHKNHAVAKEKPVICEKCGKSFVNASFLQIHLYQHSEEKTFLCSDCGKGFKTKLGLIQHLRSHSEIRRFSCEFCQNTFKYKHHLKQHMAVHGMLSTPRYGRRGKKATEVWSDSSDSNTNE